MRARQLTERERAVLDALLSVDIEGAEALLCQASEVVVVDTCGCGCPSVDFQHGRVFGMNVRVNADVTDSYDGLFLYTIEDLERGEILGGIEWVGVGETNPNTFPSPHLLDIRPA
ncbi:hypothetical protein [Actinoplanes solisilvae]|uniref:hypothetical protein n=1 Tax=Actinoplanes solisilvae TaxID=2486853 RepID=UPI000FD9EF52|nr:hypothetical protein [Actinoplanes solisilvae]